MEVLAVRTSEDLDRLIDRYRSQQAVVRREVASICRAMEGSVSWSEAWEMSHRDRRAVVELLEKINSEHQKAMSRFGK